MGVLRLHRLPISAASCVFIYIISKCNLEPGAQPNDTSTSEITATTGSPFINMFETTEEGPTSTSTTTNIISVQTTSYTAMNSTAEYLERIAGSWQMTNSENVKEYLQALGVNYFYAYAADNVMADVDITLTSTGFVILTTTNGLVSQTSEQVLSISNDETYRHPFTGENVLLSVIKTVNNLKVVYKHQSMGTVETAQYTLRHNDNELIVHQTINTKTEAATLYFKRKKQ